MALRHWAIVGCDYQHGVLVGGYAGDHVVNKFLVTWNVNKADIAGIDVGKAQIDG